MNEEKHIEIIRDENGIIIFDDITIIHDQVSREDVLRVKEEIKELEDRRQEIDASLLNLKAKLEYAERIILLADEKKQNEVESNE